MGGEEQALYGWGPGWHMGWMGFGGFLIVLLIALAVWGATRASGGGPSRESPIEELKRRYARGEIDRDTYLRMLRDLGGH